MSKPCMICEVERPASVIAKVFDRVGLEVTLRLCQEHDIELYKAGQIKFMAKYNVRLDQQKNKNSNTDDALFGENL